METSKRERTVRTSGLHPGFWIRGGELDKLKCRRGEVIRIIGVHMNLPDPRGGGELCPGGANYPPRPPQCSPVHVLIRDMHGHTEILPRWKASCNNCAIETGK